MHSIYLATSRVPTRTAAASQNSPIQRRCEYTENTSGDLGGWLCNVLADYGNHYVQLEVGSLLGVTLAGLVKV